MRGTEAGPLVTVQPGRVPLILSAPHGGRRAIPGVAARRGLGVRQFATRRDDNTAELAELLAAELESALGARPFLVVARFAREYLDVNRPAHHAYESEAARPAYDAYHRALADACRAVRDEWGHGLLLDLHGQSRRPGAVCRGTGNGKTVRRLVERCGAGVLTGPAGFFGLLAGAGYAVVPEPGSAAHEDPHYNGGHIVRTYGSHQGSGVDAVQLELGVGYRQPQTLPRTARDLAQAVRGVLGVYLPGTGRAHGFGTGGGQ